MRDECETSGEKISIPTVGAHRITPETIGAALNLPDWVGMAYLQFNRSFAAESDPASLPLHLKDASEKRKREFAAGRRVARQALIQAGCSDAGPPGIGEDRLPVWPCGWKGSISHSDDAAIAIAAPDTACQLLGIDIERVIEQKLVRNIQSQVAYSGEMDLLEEFDSSTRLTILFSAKEALYKALYPQVKAFFDFQAARLERASPTGLNLQLVHSWGEDWQAGAVVPVRYAFLGDHVCTAVCLPC